VSLTIDIDGEMAAELNQFQPKLEATLILHVGLGKDHFIPVFATYGMCCSTRLAPFSTPQIFFGPGCVCVCACAERFTRASIT